VPVLFAFVTPSYPGMKVIGRTRHEDSNLLMTGKSFGEASSKVKAEKISKPTYRESEATI
jgi:hypothetical protein